jgi:hypothetical protein
MKQGLITDKYGTKYWYLNGELHRVDGPAIECVDGVKYWFLNDKRHRVDGPAIECADGVKYWFLNGQLVYSKDNNNLHKFNNLSETFKHTIVKYSLTI